MHARVVSGGIVAGIDDTQEVSRDVPGLTDYAAGGGYAVAAKRTNDAQGLCLSEHGSISSNTT